MSAVGTTVVCEATGEQLASFDSEGLPVPDAEAVARYGQFIADRLCDRLGLPIAKVRCSQQIQLMAYNPQTQEIEIGRLGQTLALHGDAFEATVAHEVAHHMHTCGSRWRRFAWKLIERLTNLAGGIALSQLGLPVVLAFAIAVGVTWSMAWQIEEVSCDLHAAKWLGPKGPHRFLTLLRDSREIQETRLRDWRPWRDHPPVQVRLLALRLARGENVAPRSRWVDAEGRTCPFPLDRSA
jgi:hypothetical protein